MAKDPTIPFYASDFMMDTMQLDDELVGAYIRILCLLWVNGKCYSDAKALLRISPNAPKVIEALKDKFTFYDDGTFTNNRLEKERAKRQENREKRKEAGSLGAKKRWQNDSKTNGKSYSKKITKEKEKEKEKEDENEKEYEEELLTIPSLDFILFDPFLEIHPEYKDMLERNQFKEDDPYYLLYKRLKLICGGDMIGGVTGFQALKTAVDNIKAEDWFVNNGGLFMLINPSKPIGFAKTNIAKYMRKLKNGNTGNYKKQTTRPTATRGFGEQTVRVISL